MIWLEERRGEEARKSKPAKSCFQIRLWYNFALLRNRQSSLSTTNQDLEIQIKEKRVGREESKEAEGEPSRLAWGVTLRERMKQQ